MKPVPVSKIVLDIIYFLDLYSIILGEYERERERGREGIDAQVKYISDKFFRHCDANKQNKQRSALRVHSFFKHTHTNPYFLTNSIFFFLSLSHVCTLSLTHTHTQTLTHTLSHTETQNRLHKPTHTHTHTHMHTPRIYI